MTTRLRNPTCAANEVTNPFRRALSRDKGVGSVTLSWPRTIQNPILTVCLSCDLICLLTSFQFNLSKTIKYLYLTHLEIPYTNEIYLDKYICIYCSTRLCTETEEPVPYWIEAKIHKRDETANTRKQYHDSSSEIICSFSLPFSQFLWCVLPYKACKNPGFVSVGLGASNSTSRPSQPGHLHTIRATLSDNPDFLLPTSSLSAQDLNLEEYISLAPKVKHQAQYIQGIMQTSRCLLQISRPSSSDTAATTRRWLVGVCSRSPTWKTATTTCHRPKVQVQLG